MRKVKPINIIWKYVGNEGVGKKVEAERVVRQVYDRIFKKVVERIQTGRELRLGDRI